VNQQQSIIALREQGWSARRIARELGLDRGTVGKYLAGNSKPATNPQTGLSAINGSPIRAVNGSVLDIGIFA